jgi:hypothetical protein
MELPEKIEDINNQLISEFGIATDNGKPMFRVVWADDQLEKRLLSHTPEGMQLIHPEVHEVKKYAKFCRDAYVLERLVIVPVYHERELPSQAQSYEPLHFFWDKNRKPLPPKFYICKFIVDTLYASMGKSGMVKYVDEMAKNPIEETAKRIAELEEYLFGDESDLMLRTVTGEAVAYTGEPKIDASQKENKS